MTNESRAQAGALPRRRSVLAGGAWSVPAVVTAAATPAMAASAPPALQGNGSITRTSCGATVTAAGPVAVTFDSRPAYTTTTQPTGGDWVTNVPASTTIVKLTRTIYVDSRLTSVNWSYASTATADRQWSLPTLDSSAPVLAGLVAYTTTYQATLTSPWTTVSGAQPPYVIATYGVYFKMTATAPANSCGGTFTFRNYRTATLSNGVYLTSLKAPATA